MKLDQHPLYTKFAERYAFDIKRFAIEVCGLSLTEQQVGIAEAFQKTGSRVSVSSGHGTGKTTLYALICLWHLLCYKHSNAMLTAPKVEQVRNLVWKEVANIVNYAQVTGRFPWVFDSGGFLVVETQRIYVRGNKENWYVIAKTAPRGAPENMAGAHGRWYMVLVDEASGVSDEVFGVVTGALTNDDNRMMCASQPTRPSGFFYETHHRMAKKNGGIWEAITTSSVDSPLVGAKAILEKKQQYTKEQFLVKILGQFPQNVNGMLTSREDIDKCFKTGRIIGDDEPYGFITAIDIGGGEGRDYSSAVYARVIGSGNLGEEARRVEVIEIPYYTNIRKIHSFLGDVTHFSKSKDETMNKAIDVMGLGHGAPSYLEAAGVSNIIKVRWGAPCWQNQNKEIYHNLVAQAHVSVQRAVQDGRLSFLTVAHRDRILDEGSRIPYDFDGQFRYRILDKVERASKGIQSPDIWDAVAFLFLEGMDYNVHSNYGGAVELSFEDKKVAFAGIFSDYSD